MLFPAVKLKNVLFVKPRRPALYSGHCTDDLSAGDSTLWQQVGSSTGTAHRICHCFFCQPTRKTGCSHKEVAIPSYEKQPSKSFSCPPGLLPLGAEWGSFLHHIIIWRWHSLQEHLSCSAYSRIHRKTFLSYRGAHGCPPAAGTTHLEEDRNLSFQCLWFLYTGRCLLGNVF